MSLDLVAIRRQFPALEGEGRGWIHLDNAGGSQILGAAIPRLGGERVEEGARALSRWLRCHPAEVVFGRSATQLLASLASSMIGRLQRGDEIVVTDLDHDSNLGCWRRLVEHGAVIKEWRLDRESLRLRLEDLWPLLTARTRLVCFTHASHLIGTVHPIAEIARAVHQRGARVCVDGVAYAPHRPIDVRAWDVDYYVLSLYKVYGPRVAALYGRRELFEELPPGEVAHELVAALPPVVAYLESLRFDEVAAHEARLASRLLQYLDAVPGVRILGERAALPERVPTVSFVVDGKRAADLVRAAAAHRIGIQHGDFHARRLVGALGLTEGVVRVSMVHYNTLEEIDRLIAALEPLLAPSSA